MVSGVEEVLAAHDYAINDFNSAAKRDGKFIKPGVPDPGWHSCRCGRWAGYWCDFRAHVAEQLLPLIRQAQAEALYAARDALYRGEGPDMSQDSDIVYGEWLNNRADLLAGDG